MRPLAAVAAVVVFLALAGCSSSEPDTAVDPEEAESVQTGPLLAIFGLLGLAIVVLVAILLLVRRRRQRGPSNPPPQA
jgi:LPXTG-motif cell wall-anchored protein